MLPRVSTRFRWRRTHLSEDGTDSTETLPLASPDFARSSGSTERTAPVFVDSTGRRGRVVRRLAYGFGALCVAYTIALALSFMGAAPFAPGTLLPIPGVPSDEPGTVRRTPPTHSPGPTAAPGPASPSSTDVPSRPVPTSSEPADPSRPSGSASSAASPPGTTAPTPSVTSSGRPTPSTTPSTTGPGPTSDTSESVTGPPLGTRGTPSAAKVPAPFTGDGVPWVIVLIASPLTRATRS